MFVANELSTTKRKFQKPNILRKRPKIATVKRNGILENESPVLESTAFRSVLRKDISDLSQDPSPESETVDMLHNIKKPIHNLVLKSNIIENGYVKDVDAENSSENLFGAISIIHNSEETKIQNTSNAVHILNLGSLKDLSTSVIQKEQCQVKMKGCFNFIKTNDDLTGEESQTLVVAPKSKFTNAVLTAVLPSIYDQESTASCSATVASSQILSINSLSTRSIKLKCDEPNCNKGFWSEQRLKKHKNSHNKLPGSRAPVPIKIECPVKKLNDNGVENCGKIFRVRKDLLKHLNNDHTTDDAPYRCAVCGRAFFWAVGLRAHSAGQCSRDSLRCPWPGCGRAFRQPCRLREHARAHTGDRPYKCGFPNCGWAFRSASKLVRHARRHTGDRRHSCASCGRAFLRREHLRDHTLRKHNKPAGDHAHDDHDHHDHDHHAHDHTCTTEGGKNFVNNEEKEFDATAAAVRLITNEDPTDADMEKREVNSCDDKCMLSSEEGTCDAEAEAEADSQCARTHCPWPLRSPTLQQCPSAVQLLDEESPAEPSESSESNAYTVRSDLFLHGNVLINEDNEFIVGRDYSIGEQADAGEGDGDGEGGGLMDPHPTIDLMQEELMYGDTVVDESSFRVFLLNGEELT